MDEIKRQVSKARRRLIAQQFVQIFSWSMFSALLIAAVALAVPKIWPVAFAGETWTWSWIGGSVGVGLLTTAVITYLVRRSAVEAAIELDRRFGLKERVASSLTLEPAELESEAGQALMSDASRRVGRVEVHEQFGLGFSWRTLLPVVPAIAVLLIAVLLTDATLEKADAASQITKAQKDAIEKAKANARKIIQDRKKKQAVSEKGLQDIQALVEKVEKQLDTIKNDQKTDRKKMLLKFNDLAKSLDKRKQELGDPANAKKALEQLQKLDQGPAEKLGQALKEGDFKKAMEELNKLAEKMEQGKLNEQEKEQLNKQLGEMKKKLEQMAENHKQAKQDLQEEIKRRERQGDLAGAQKLQQQLDKMQQRDKQMDDLAQMAKQCENCQNAMKNGDAQEAAEQMAQMGEKLQEMQDELAEMEAVDELMEQLADAKEACQGGEGEGEGEGEDFQFARGQGSGGQGQGDGLGEGQGTGARPEEKTETGSIESKVKGNPSKGEVVRVGEAGGPNKSGTSLANIEEEIDAARTAEFDPTLNQRLPKAERDQSNEYLERFRKGR